LQPLRGRFKAGFWKLGALAPAIALAIVAVIAFAPGQVRAESEQEPEEVIVCDGLGSLTMIVNAVTLQNADEMTKSTYSSDGKCVVSMTLFDVSEDGNPADSSMTCTTTMAPIRDGYSFDVAVVRSGECATVGTDVQIDYGEMEDNWAAYSDPDEEGQLTSDDDSDQSAVSGQATCDYTTEGDDPHRSGNDASAHGWWIDNSTGGCPEYADVEVVLQAHRCEWWGCGWWTLAKREKRVREGGGRGKRATARYSCWSSIPTGWRSIIDVDLVGQSDPPDKKYIWENVDCRPYGW